MAFEIPPHHVSVDPLARINELCDRFRKEWKSGIRPVLEAFLAEVSESGQETLLRNLLPVEIEFRRRAGENPTSGEYLQRFPRHARLIRQAFFESTMMSFPSLRSTPDHGDGWATRTFELQAVNRLGKYELLRELGRGGFGVVHEAIHVQRGDRVALKTLPISSGPRPLANLVEGIRERREAADQLARFKREFRALADVSHPNLVGLHGLEKDGDIWFFTMDLVQGVDFLEYVRPEGKLDIGRLSATFSQLVAGVMALHARGVVHRDLKPSNVMVTTEGRVVILDFGLVAELQTDSDETRTELSRRFAGTPTYAAPEQLHGRHTAASDWYSVGLMAYEAIAGHRPFSGGGMDVLLEKQKKPAPPLDNQSAVPEEFVRLIEELLRTDPNDRPDALAIAEVASTREPDSQSLSISERPIRSGKLIGRETQLNQLRRAWEKTLHGERSRSVLITGRSGEGKTCLFEQFAHPLRQERSALVLAGRCYDREAVPFKALDGIIDSLCVHLQKMSNEDVALLLPDDLAFLVQLFPVFQRIEVIARAEGGDVSGLDRAQVQHRAFMALRLLLSRLARRQPVILFSDDVQWGDGESAEGLAKLLGGSSPPPILFIASCRSDEMEESAFLSSFVRVASSTVGNTWDEVVRVGPFSTRQCVELTITHLQRDDDRIRQRATEFATKTGGNPYLLLELIGCFDPESDSFQALTLNQIIERKLERLDITAARLLDSIAVAGRAMPIEEIFAAAGLDRVCTGTLTHMRSENLVRFMGGDDSRTIDSYHDKVRETILDSLTEERIRECHLGLARAIQSSLGIGSNDAVQKLLEDASLIEGPLLSRAGELSRHYDGGGDSKRTVAYALLAGETAKRQFAFDVAVGQFELARHRLTCEDRGVRFRIEEGLGRSLLQLGRYEDAAAAFSRAIESAESMEQRADASLSLAEIYQRQGKFLKSLNQFREVMPLLGLSMPKTNLGLLRDVVRVRGKRPWQMLKFFNSTQTPAARNFLTLRLLIGLKLVMVWTSTPADFWCMYQIANQTARFNHPLTLAYHKMAPVMNQCAWGRFPKCETVYDQLTSEIKETGDLSQFVRNQRSKGWYQIWAGKFLDASISLREVEEFSTDEIPDFYSSQVSRCWRGYAVLQTGSLTDAAQIAISAFRENTLHGHDRFAGLALETWTRAADGRLPFPSLRSCFGDVSEDTTLTIQLLSAEAIHWLAQGEVKRAFEVAGESLAIARRNWLANGYSAIAIPVYLRASHRYAASLRKSDGRAARRVLKNALKMRRWIYWIVRYVPGHAAYTLREQASCLRELGRTRRSIKLAQKSCRIARDQGALYELAQSRLLEAELAVQLKLPDCHVRLGEARGEMERYHSMIDNVVQAGEDLASSTFFNAVSDPDRSSDRAEGREKGSNA